MIKVAVLLAVAAAVVSSSSAASRVAADPLVGTWDTAPMPLSKIRAAEAAHGYTAAQITKMFQNLKVTNHIKKTVQVEMSFYRDNGRPFQIVRFWDPTAGSRPPDSAFDHGPYAFLPGQRFTTKGTDPPTDKWVTTYRYSTAGKQLKLGFVGFVQPSEPEKNRLAYQKRFIMYAAGPYKKVS
jgi:hypothetical protein